MALLQKEVHDPYVIVVTSTAYTLVFMCPLQFYAMEHAGIGPTHVNNFLITMNIPAVDPKLLRRQERVIGPVIEKVAQESCDTATQDELSATAPGEGITMSYDCGW